MAGGKELLVVCCLVLGVWGGIPRPTGNAPDALAGASAAAALLSSLMGGGLDPGPPADPAPGPADPPAPPADAADPPAPPADAAAPVDPPVDSAALVDPIPDTAAPVDPVPDPAPAESAKPFAPAAAIVDPGLDPVPAEAAVFASQETAEEAAMARQLCIASGCEQGRLCRVAHPEDCRLYVACEMFERRGLRAQVMPCALGTFWASQNDTCGRADLVDCPLDKCKGKLTPYTYDHIHRGQYNCRHHWRCEGGKSFPDCCAKRHRYDGTRCVPDDSCTDICSLSPSETCAGRGVNSLPSPDRSCKAYFECVKGKPVETCCPDGEGYDALEEKCMPDPTCVTKCIVTPEATCPYQVVPESKNQYLHAGVKMSCATGTSFDVVDCICKLDSSVIDTTEVCPMAIVIKPQPDPGAYYTKVTNEGKITAAVLMDGSGSLQNGAKYKNKTTALFGGQFGILVPYYASQDLDKVFLELIVRPSSTAGATRQILAASCVQTADGVPTLEVAVNPSSAQAPLVIKAAAGGNFINHGHQLPTDTWSKITIIYDGTQLLSQVESPWPEATGADQAVSPLSGALEIGSRGVLFGRCLGVNTSASFIGEIYKIRFNKCLKADQKIPALA